MVQHWEDTLRALGALLDVEGVARPALFETREGLYMQVLIASEPLLRLISHEQLSAITSHAKRLRTEPDLPWSEYFLSPRSRPGVINKSLKSYGGLLREVGRYIDNQRLKGFVFLETKAGYYVVNGFRPTPKADGSGQMWVAEENVWPEKKLEELAAKERKLREMGS